MHYYVIVGLFLFIFINWFNLAFSTLVIGNIPDCYAEYSPKVNEPCVTQ